jgi:hypothetical protein
VIEIEHCRLRAFEHDAAVVVQSALHERGCVGHVWAKALSVARMLSLDVGALEREAAVDAGEEQILLLERDFKLGRKYLGIEKVLNPQSDAGGLVGVRGPDTPLGGPQPVLAEPALGHSIELQVVRHDEMGVSRDL